MTLDQLTCRCGDVYDDLVDLVNHCRLLHPDADIDPVDPVTDDTTSTGTTWLSTRIDEVLAEVSAGLDLPPGLYLAWDTDPILRGDDRRQPSVE